MQAFFPALPGPALLRSWIRSLDGPKGLCPVLAFPPPVLPAVAWEVA